MTLKDRLNIFLEKYLTTPCFHLRHVHQLNAIEKL